MDLDPFEPVGIDGATVDFLDVFLLHCLLAESPPDTPEEIAALARNQHRAAERGREPGLTLERGGQQVPLLDWARQIVGECAPIAAALDAADGGNAHRDALDAALLALREPERLPSARVLQAIDSEFGGSYTRFVDACSERNRDLLMRRPYPAALHERLSEAARESLKEQQRIEADDSIDFEAFRQHYLSAQRLSV